MNIPPLSVMMNDLPSVTIVKHSTALYEAKVGGQTELGDSPEGAVFHLMDRRQAFLARQGISAGGILGIEDVIRGPIRDASGCEIGMLPGAGQD